MEKYKEETTMKKLSLVLALLLCFATFCNGALAATFPEHDLSGVVPYNAGGGTDNVMRPLAKYAGDILGVTLTVNNMPGASGATGTAFVADQAPDGYSVLMVAEGPCLYDAMKSGKYTFADFEQICLVGAEPVYIVVAKDSPFQTIKELVDHAVANPASLTLPISGPAALGSIVGAMLYRTSEAIFANTPSGGDADAFAQLLSGMADVCITKTSTIGSYYETGDVRILAVVDDKRSATFPDVPAITEEIPAFADSLPFSSFYCVSVRKDTPAEVVTVLKDAFKAAFENEEFQAYLKNTCAVEPLGYSGEEADAYIKGWRKSVINALYAAGKIETSPAELGIE